MVHIFQTPKYYLELNRKLSLEKKILPLFLPRTEPVISNHEDNALPLPVPLSYKPFWVTDITITVSLSVLSNRLILIVVSVEYKVKTGNKK